MATKVPELWSSCQAGQDDIAPRSELGSAHKPSTLKATAAAAGCDGQRDIMQLQQPGTKVAVFQGPDVMNDIHLSQTTEMEVDRNINMKVTLSPEVPDPLAPKDTSTDTRKSGRPKKPGGNTVISGLKGFMEKCVGKLLSHDMRQVFPIVSTGNGGKFFINKLLNRNIRRSKAFPYRAVAYHVNRQDKHGADLQEKLDVVDDREIQTDTEVVVLMSSNSCYMESACFMQDSKLAAIQVEPKMTDAVLPGLCQTSGQSVDKMDVTDLDISQTPGQSVSEMNVTDVAVGQSTRMCHIDLTQRDLVQTFGKDRGDLDVTKPVSEQSAGQTMEGMDFVSCRTGQTLSQNELLNVTNASNGHADYVTTYHLVGQTVHQMPLAHTSNVQMADAQAGIPCQTVHKISVASHGIVHTVDQCEDERAVTSPTVDQLPGQYEDDIGVRNCCHSQSPNLNVSEMGVTYIASYGQSDGQTDHPIVVRQTVGQMCLAKQDILQTTMAHAGISDQKGEETDLAQHGLCQGSGPKVSDVDVTNHATGLFSGKDKSRFVAKKSIEQMHLPETDILQTAMAKAGISCQIEDIYTAKHGFCRTPLPKKDEMRVTNHTMGQNGSQFWGEMDVTSLVSGQLTDQNVSYPDVRNPDLDQALHQYQLDVTNPGIGRDTSAIADTVLHDKDKQMSEANMAIQTAKNQDGIPDQAEIQTDASNVNTVQTYVLHNQTVGQTGATNLGHVDLSGKTVEYMQTESSSLAYPGPVIAQGQDMLASITNLSSGNSCQSQHNKGTLQASHSGHDVSPSQYGQTDIQDANFCGHALDQNLHEQVFYDPALVSEIDLLLEKHGISIPAKWCLQVDEADGNQQLFIPGTLAKQHVLTPEAGVQLQDQSAQLPVVVAEPARMTGKNTLHGSGNIPNFDMFENKDWT